MEFGLLVFCVVGIGWCFGCLELVVVVDVYCLAVWNVCVCKLVGGMYAMQIFNNTILSAHIRSDLYRFTWIVPERASAIPLLSYTHIA